MTFATSAEGSRVSPTVSDMPPPPLIASGQESRWLTWTRSASATIVAIVLVALGVANIATRARWTEVEDGVHWEARAEGVTAVAVAPGSPAAAAGITAGDILLAVNAQPVQSLSDILALQQQATEGTRLSYTLLQLGAQRVFDVVLESAAPSGSMYYVLASVGLFTLLVGASVRLRRPYDQATLHFFWLCVAFFGVFSFSFNGPFDQLDWVFFWGDAVAMALLPPLLLHFTLVFPERSQWQSVRPFRLTLPVMYLPALVIFAARVVTMSGGAADGPAFSRAIEAI